MMYAVHNCVAGYLYRAPQERRVETKKSTRKVENTSGISTGRRFNFNAANKSSNGHIDIVV